eukprot:scaffold52563_cov36-Phaeocystis_antarctica.AAC.1
MATLAATHLRPHRHDPGPAVNLDAVLEDLWCHGTRYVRHTRGWYAYRAAHVLRLRYVRHAGDWHAST